MGLQEPDAGRFLDVPATRLEEVAAGFLPPANLLQLFELVHEPTAIPVEQLPALGQWRGLAVELLDLAGQRLALALDLSDPGVDAGEVVLEASALGLRGGERPAGRLDLGTAPGGLLPDPAPHVLDPAALVFGGAEDPLRVVELSLTKLELGHDTGELVLETGDVVPQGVDAGRPGRLGGQLVPRRRLSLQRFAESPLRALAIGLRLAEELFGVGERDRPLGANVRRRKHVVVEGVQPLAREPPPFEALVPTVAAPLPLPHQRTKTRCGQALRQRFGLSREGLMPLGRLGLLLQGLQLSPELGEDVLQT